MASSSRGGGHSESDEAEAATLAPAATPTDLSCGLELAQVCHFCTTFRKPLRLPAFSRTVRPLAGGVAGCSDFELPLARESRHRRHKRACSTPTRGSNPLAWCERSVAWRLPLQGTDGWTRLIPVARAYVLGTLHPRSCAYTNRFSCCAGPPRCASECVVGQPGTGSLGAQCIAFCEAGCVGS